MKVMQLKAVAIYIAFGDYVNLLSTECCNDMIICHSILSDV